MYASVDKMVLCYGYHLIGLPRSIANQFTTGAKSTLAVSLDRSETLLMNMGCF